MKFILDLCIISIIVYALYIPKFITGIMGVNISEEAIFGIMPLSIIVFYRITHGRITLPYFFLFIITIVWFLLGESDFFRPGVVHNYTYIIGITEFYVLFLGAVNYGISENQLEKILKFSIIIAITFILAFYLIYLNIIPTNFASSVIVHEKGGSYQARYNVDNLLSINGISMTAAYGILCVLLYKNLNFKNRIILKYTEFIIVFLLGIILLHASRGAFFIAILVLIIFYKKNWKNLSKEKRLLYISVVFFFTMALLFKQFSFIIDVPIISRYIEENERISRLMQIYVTWVNFKENMLFGVGFHNAARNVIEGYTRSNFHYTQILASNGIFFFFLYLLFLVKMFWCKNKYYLTLMLTIFGFSSLMFYNWSEMLCIGFIAYFVYFSKISSEQKLT